MYECKENPYRSPIFDQITTLDQACCEARYLNWWQLADRHPEYIGVCEMLAKLLCHASTNSLKCDTLIEEIFTLKMHWKCHKWS